TCGGVWWKPTSSPFRSSPNTRKPEPLGHYVPHTTDEIAAMLDFIGLSSLDELFTAVPEALRLTRGLDVGPGLSEPDVLAEMDRLTGLPVANASLYDGATALVEGINLTAAASKKQRVLMSRGVNPFWRETVRTFAAGTGHELVDVPLGDGGATAWPDDVSDIGTVVVQYPNYLGVIEDVAAARQLADRLGALLIVAF